MIPTDIEIYANLENSSRIIEWLEQRLGKAEHLKKGKKGVKFQITYQGHTLPCTIMEKVSKGYSSLWIDSSHSPWSTDRELARELFKGLNLEIRCTPGSWQNQQDPDLWLSISDQGEKEIIWKS